MSAYGFLRSRRWIGIAALTVVVSVVCVFLGLWQLHRHEVRAAAIDRVQTNTVHTPVPLTELLPTAGAGVGDALEWRTVTVSGEYVGDPVALPQRGIETGAADHALAVLAVDGADGGTWLIVVDRGSYPTDAFGDPTQVLATPSEPVQVTLRLRPAEPASTRDAIAGQVFRVAPQQVLDAADPTGGVTGTLMTGAYGWLVTETPTTADPPTPLAVPAPDYRSNLSYALQWWTFALLAFVGYGVLARRERRTLAQEGAGGTTGGPPSVVPSSSGRPRRRSDAEIEDAEIDAAEQARTPS